MLGQGIILPGSDTMLPPNNANNVSTIMVTGFPPDVRERELENLLRFLPYYEGCSRITITERGMRCGFAKFATRYGDQRDQQNTTSSTVPPTITTTTTLWGGEDTGGEGPS